MNISNTAIRALFVFLLWSLFNTTNTKICLPFLSLGHALVLNGMTWIHYCGGLALARSQALTQSLAHSSLFSNEDGGEEGGENGKKAAER